MQTHTSLFESIFKNRISIVLASLLLALGMGLAACEETTGPEGPEGPAGAEGPQGPVGPAGEDGSRIFADNGAPDDAVGSEGDLLPESGHRRVLRTQRVERMAGQPGRGLAG